jgi:long-subunit fatty acid transport protein
MKNLKTGLLITLVGIFSVEMSAQNYDKAPKIGVKGGLSFSNLYVDNIDDDEMLTGFNIGLFAKFPLAEKFAFQTEVYYTNKGAELTYNESFATGSTKFKLDYIEVPLLAVYNVTNNFNIHAGGYVAYMISGKVTNESDPGIFDFESQLNTDDFNRFDAGLAAGIAFDFDPISIGARYYYGLTEVGKEQNYSGFNLTFPDAKNSVLQVYASFYFN